MLHSCAPYGPRLVCSCHLGRVVECAVRAPARAPALSPGPAAPSATTVLLAVAIALSFLLPLLRSSSPAPPGTPDRCCRWTVCWARQRSCCTKPSTEPPPAGAGLSIVGGQLKQVRYPTLSNVLGEQTMVPPPAAGYLGAAGRAGQGVVRGAGEGSEGGASSEESPDWVEQRSADSCSPPSEVLYTW